MLYSLICVLSVVWLLDFSYFSWGNKGPLHKTVVFMPSHTSEILIRSWNTHLVVDSICLCCQLKMYTILRWRDRTIFRQNLNCWRFLCSFCERFHIIQWHCCFIRGWSQTAVSWLLIKYGVNIQETLLIWLVIFQTHACTRVYGMLYHDFASKN